MVAAAGKLQADNLTDAWTTVLC